MIYVEILDGLINNYCASVIIDNSRLCFDKISYAHSFGITRIVLSSFVAIEIPCLI